MPFAQVRVSGRQAVMTRIEEVIEHAEEIEIHKTGPLVQQERLVDQHFLDFLL